MYRVEIGRNKEHNLNWRGRLKMLLI